MSRAKAETRVYKSLEDLPEVLEPGKYIIEGKEIIIYEPVDKRTLLQDVKKIDKYAKRYGASGWI